MGLLGLAMADTNPMDFARLCSSGECPTDWKNIDGDCFMFAGWEETRAREVCKENNAEYRDNFLLRENSDSATSHSVSVCVVRRETQCDCGRPNRIANRIVGGGDADKNEYPWQGKVHLYKRLRVMFERVDIYLLNNFDR